MPRRDIVIVMGDMNAKVGSDNAGREHVMGAEEWEQLTRMVNSLWTYVR